MAVKKGDRIGPEGILVLEPHSIKQGKNWLARFQCPICKKPFDAYVFNVKSGNTTKCKNCASKNLK